MSGIHRSLTSGRAQRKRARVAVFMMFAVAATIFAASASNAANPVTAIVAQTGDTGNGHIDRISITFSGLMNVTKTPQVAASPDGPGIWVEGYEVSSVAWAEANAAMLNINLVESEDFDTAAKPAVKYIPDPDTSAGLESADGQELDLQDLSGARIIDRAGPALIKVTARDVGVANMFNAAATGNPLQNEELSLVFSETVSLNGATPMDKWLNLERAMTFRKAAGTLNCVDGSGISQSGTSFNFPQPTGAQPNDPISVSGSAITVTAKAGNSIPGTVAAANQFRTVPVEDFWCKVGVDTVNNGLIRDAANNMASTQDAAGPGVGLNLIYPVDIRLVVANTVDSAPADGKVDAIEFEFDQNLNDATIQAQLPQISVSKDGVDAIIDTTTVDTGTTTDDKKFYVHFTLPSGTVWDGGVKPDVAYSKPSGCTGTSGTGIKGKVPSWTAATPWEACAGSFGQASIDRITPLVKSATTLDVDGDGLLDRIEATFSEPMVTGGAAGWKVDTRQATAFAVDTTDNKKATIDFPEGTTGDTGTLPSIQYTSQGTSSSAAVVDFGQNEIASQTRNANLDGAAPRIRTATVLGTNQGKVNKAELVYSENIIDPAGTAASSFTIGESTSTGIVTGAANDNILTINVEPIDGTDRKAVAYSGSGAPIRDVANNVTGAQSFAAADVVDGAKPVGIVTISEGAPMSAGVKTVVVTFSEPMTTTAAPQVVLHAASNKDVQPIQAPGHEATGWLTDTPTTWEGSVTVVGGEQGDCLVPTGCQVSVTADGATDASPAVQPQFATAILNTEIDTIAPTSPVPGTFATTIASGESVPANTVNMFTSSFSLGGTFIAGDAAGGTLELLVDTNPLSPPAQSAIGATATSATATTSFADNAALQTAIAEGARTLALELCDDAQNCTPSATTLGITADYTPVDLSLSAPAGDNVVAGGSTVAITWNGDEAAAGFDHTVLEYSADNGSTYSAISATQPLDGSFDWTVPAIDAAEAIVRAASVDVNGNKAFGTSAAFAIDSTAPVVSITKPTTSFPFVPAGAPTQVKWNATDASIARATNPIKIEYSLNGGSTWAEINGGDYSHENDGEEDWNVPAGSTFTLKLRVTATDATEKSTAILSSKLAKGVDGFVGDRYGSVFAFGTANTATNEMKLPSGYSVRGIALRKDGTAGYRVLHQGAIYPYAIGSTSMPSKPSYTKFGGDRARGIVLRTDTSGYVLDMYGRLWPFGGAPKASVSKTFTSDYARSVVMLPNGRGGYVLDKYGRLYRFRVGSYAWPPSITASTLSSARAVGFVLRSNLRSGWVLDSYGRLYRFGGAPSRTSYGVSKYAYAKALVLVAQDSGYWVDGRGRLKPFGSAFGNPTRTTLGSNRARGAVM